MVTSAAAAASPCLLLLLLVGSLPSLTLPSPSPCRYVAPRLSFTAESRWGARRGAAGVGWGTVVAPRGRPRPRHHGARELALRRREGPPRPPTLTSRHL